MWNSGMDLVRLGNKVEWKWNIFGRSGIVKLC